MEQRVISDAEFTSAVKRLNDRIKQFHKLGMTDSQQYKTLLGAPRRLDDNTEIKGALYDLKGLSTRTSTDKLGLSYSYPVLTTKRANYTADQIADIVRLGKRGGQTTVGNAIKQAKEGLKARGINKPLPWQVREQVKVDAETHDFIIKNANDIYLVERFAQAVWRDTKLTPSEQDDILSMYNNPDYWSKNETGKPIFVGDGKGETIKPDTPR